VRRKICNIFILKIRYTNDCNINLFLCLHDFRTAIWPRLWSYYE